MAAKATLEEKLDFIENFPTKLGKGSLYYPRNRKPCCILGHLDSRHKLFDPYTGNYDTLYDYWGLTQEVWLMNDNIEMPINETDEERATRMLVYLRNVWGI